MKEIEMDIMGMAESHHAGIQKTGKPSDGVLTDLGRCRE
jgi:hypothetical protein